MISFLISGFIFWASINQSLVVRFETTITFCVWNVKVEWLDASEFPLSQYTYWLVNSLDDVPINWFDVIKLEILQGTYDNAYGWIISIHVFILQHSLSLFHVWILGKMCPSQNSKRLNGHTHRHIRFGFARLTIRKNMLVSITLQSSFSSFSFPYQVKINKNSWVNIEMFHVSNKISQK